VPGAALCKSIQIKCVEFYHVVSVRFFFFLWPQAFILRIENFPGGVEPYPKQPELELGGVSVKN
jgi:hypothetical protein